MKRLPIFFLALFLSVAHAADWQVVTGKVVGVLDGDTIDILTIDKTQERIRLMGIDAPEKKQPFGQRAKENLSDLSYGHTVHVEWAKRDRYKRIVGKVLDEKGRDINLAMVDAGFAWWYVKYQREQREEDRELYGQAETAARKKKQGLWSDVEFMPPWEFRHK